MKASNRTQILAESCEIEFTTYGVRINNEGLEAVVKKAFPEIEEYRKYVAEIDIKIDLYGTEDIKIIGENGATRVLQTKSDQESF